MSTRLNGTILVADDDRAIRTVLSQALSRAGARVRSTGSASTLWRWVEDGEGDVVVTDVMMPDGDALDLLPAIRKKRPELPVIVMSAQNTMLTAIRAAEVGAYEYLPKPFDLRQVLEHVERALEGVRTPSSTTAPDAPRDEGLPIIGRSPAMQEVYRIMARLMNTDLTVMINGESGTGKELVARALHSFGWRKQGPFVAVNMAAIPRDLIEAELFGHEKGAFTGADKRRIGLFEQAKGGTLFLDEVTEMDIELQSKLLRVLEERKLTRVGGSELIDVDVRILAASNRDLRAEVDAGRFREDLLYRLMVFPIELPPLSQRDGDVPLLAEAVLARLNQEYEQSKRLSPEAIADLERYPWPGNVRELNNLLRRAFVLADEVLGPEHLRFEAPLDGGQAEASSPAAGEGSEALAFRVGESIAQVEQRLIEATLEAYGGDKPRASDDLGISLKTLYSRLKVYASVREAQGDS